MHQVLKYTCAVLFFYLWHAAPTAAQYRFIENGGQWDQQVAFRTDIPGGKFYLEKDRFTFDLYDAATVEAVFSAHAGNPDPMPPPPLLDCHAYQMVFQGSSFQGSPFGKNPFKTAYSFFTGDDPAHWAGNLRAFPEVTYTNLYPGIDLKVYSNSALKYDFIIAPGADPRSIAIEYRGVKPKVNRHGQLEIQTSVDDILESRPFAYQWVDGLKQRIDCEYVIRNNVLRFKVGSYDTGKELIIDPELIFSTFSGSLADNFGYSATYDQQGHLYSGSSAFGAGYPVTTGAYQTSWAGGNGNGNAGTDIAITKFSLDGTALIYSTYLGGSQDELPHSLVTNADDELFVFGTTGSANFPVTPGAIQPVFAGGTTMIPSGIGIAYVNGADMVISRLSASGGNLLGSTYLGGSQNDGTNTATNLRKNYADEVRGEIELDPQGNPVIGSCTFSTDFPMATGAFQPTKGDVLDGVLFRVSADMTTLMNTTFLGGTGQDAIYSIHVTPDNKITAGGGTSSSNLPTTPGVYQQNYGGGNADGFIAVFNEDLNSLEALTYYGSDQYDQVYFVERDSDGNPHVYGQTNAPGNTFIQNAGFSIPNSGMLVSSFSPDLTLRWWSTVFGNGVNVPSLSPTAFSVDICNRVYLSGWGGIVNGFGGTSGLPITTDALQSTTDNNDFYFMVLEGDASALTFATYYGGNQSPEHVDGGTSRFDRGGKIYQAACAGCHGNSDWPIYPENAYSATNNSTNGCNLGVVKIDFDLPTVIADFDAEAVCLPDSVHFENTSVLYSESNPTYIWHFPNGDTSFDANPAYLFDTPGTYTVELILLDPNACNISDTIQKTVQVFPELSISLADTLVSCTGNSFSIEATSTGAATWYQWGLDPEFTTIISEGAQDSTLTFSAGTVTYIYLQTSNGLCDRLDSVLLAPASDLNISISDTLLCNTDDITVSYSLSAGSQPASSLWTPDTFLISGQDSSTATFSPSGSFVLGVEVETIFGCTLSAEASVEVHPIYLETTDDTLSCSAEPVTLTANSFGSAQSFTWALDPGFQNVLNPTGDSLVTVTPEALTWYFIRVENEGCLLTDSVAVSLLSTGTTVSPDQYICAGDTAWLTVTNNFPGNQLTHHWEPESFIISGQGTAQVQVLVNEPETFTVLSATPQGCETLNSTSVYPSMLGNLAVSATASPQNISPGQQVTLNALPVNPDYTYIWSPSEGLSNPNGSVTQAGPDSTTTYYLQVLDVSDIGVCIRTDSVTVYVFEMVCGEPNIFVPNAFTPNGDGENDVVLVRGGNITELKFAIYDRWGEKVFETNDQLRGWDGNYKGNLAEPAVYVYYLQAKCGDGQDYFKKGNITLVR